jgi:hypothetical protein
MKEKKFYFIITVLFFCSFMTFTVINAEQASAKVASIVVVTTDGSNYEYNYDELKQSAVSNALGDTSGAALYQHFLKNNAGIKDFYDDSRNVYVSNSVVTSEAVSKKLSGLSFDINSYIENQSTPTETVTTSKFKNVSGTVVSVDSGTGFDLDNIQ